VSYDPSDIILIRRFGAQETFLIMLKTVMLINIFMESVKKNFRILWRTENSKAQNGT